jgi:hypothetical protein
VAAAKYLVGATTGLKETIYGFSEFSIIIIK